MRPVTPNSSPPALPTNTRSFHASGAIGTDSPFFGSPIATSQRSLPVAASMPRTCASPVPRNSMPPLKATPRLTLRHVACELPFLMARRAIDRIRRVEGRDVQRSTHGDDAGLEADRVRRFEDTGLLQ